VATSRRPVRARGSVSYDEELGRAVSEFEKGHYRESRRRLRRLVEERPEPSVELLLWLGRVEVALGEWWAAQAHLVEARTRSLGSERRWTGEILLELAEIHRERDEEEQAWSLGWQAHGLLVGTVPERPALVGRALVLLGFLAVERDELTWARALFARARGLQEEQEMPDFRSLAWSLVGQATVARRVELLQFADGSGTSDVEPVRRALERLETVLGPDHPETLRLRVFCLDPMAVGRRFSAVVARGLDARVGKVLGEHHPVTLQLRRVLWFLDRPEEGADEAMLALLSRQEARFGEEHLQVAETLAVGTWELLRTAGNEKELAAAFALLGPRLERIESILLRAPGQGQLGRYARSMILATALHACRESLAARMPRAGWAEGKVRHAEARSFLARILAARGRRYGDRHPATLLVRKTIGLLLYFVGRDTEGLAELRAVNVAQRRVLTDPAHWAARNTLLSPLFVERRRGGKLSKAVAPFVADLLGEQDIDSPVFGHLLRALTALASETLHEDG